MTSCRLGQKSKIDLKPTTVQLELVKNAENFEKRLQGFSGALSR